MDGNQALSWSPDQRFVLFVTTAAGSSTVWRAPVAGGAAEPIGLSLRGAIKSPAVPPDGRRLLFRSQQPANAEVWMLDNFVPGRKGPG